MKRVVIVGGGFAGVWAALAAAARRRDDLRVDITLVSRDPWLTIRPRLYEADLDEMRVPLDEVLGPVGVRRVEGKVERLDTTVREVVLADGSVLPYDRMILATGSMVQRAAIPGAGAAFAVDTHAEAVALQAHLEGLPRGGNDPVGRYTAVVVGAGFTGIEVATTLLSRLRRIASQAGATARVVVVERAPVLAPDLSEGARRQVLRAFGDLRIEWRVGAMVEAIEADRVRLVGGGWIPAGTVVLTGGFRASPLGAQLAVPQDALGRVSVDPFLRVRGVPDVYAAGDVARALADDAGHVAPMSCQCAIPMGEVAGANAVAELLGAEQVPFRLPGYVTCLDLGEAGALFMEGWEREVRMGGFWAKLLKETINTRLIYPPRPGRRSRPGRVLGSAA